jgi:hypothetical protein
MGDEKPKIRWQTVVFAVSWAIILAAEPVA